MSSGSTRGLGFGIKFSRFVGVIGFYVVFIIRYQVLYGFRGFHESFVRLQALIRVL